MDKTLYYKIIEVLHQFMDLEVSNNLIWGQSEKYSTALFESCGYVVEDWSWYDGHILELKCTEYPEISIGYAGCADSYSIHCNDAERYINVQIEEVGKLSSKSKRSKHDFNCVEVRQKGKTKDYDRIEIPNPSPEFDSFVKQLFEWQKTFDKSIDYDYIITIYLGKEVDLEQI